MKKVKRGSSFSFFSLHPFVLLSLFSFPFRFHSFSLYFIVNERDKGKEQLEQRQREI